jgi:sugar O-acyltransferase (sialic acid O-acetyltransferase NeuD family)
MTRSVYLVGGGGHARVVLDAMLLSGVKVSGVLDPSLKRGELIFSVPVLGGDEILDDVSSSVTELVNGIGANPRVTPRQMLHEKLTARGFAFATVRHPSVLCGRECELGEGIQLLAGAVLQNRVRVGANAVVNTRASIDHDCVIGAHSFIAPGAILSGGVEVGGSVFVGAGAVLLPGIAVGRNAIIGAGAVVRENVPEDCVVAGNPAVRTRRRANG